MQADDYFAIQNLINRYFQYVDAGELEACGQLFAKADIVYRQSGKTFSKDPAGVTEQMAGFVRLYGNAQTPLTRHHSGNIIIEPVSDIKATASCSAVLFQATESMPFQTIGEASYADTFEKDESGWHFTRREMGLNFIGDLSHHLKKQV